MGGVGSGADTARTFSSLISPSTNHNKTADGLRGIAALTVVLAHFVDAFFPQLVSRNFPGVFPENLHPGFWVSFFQFPLVNVFYSGLFAVMIFFVLSGYVLTLPYFSNNLLTLKRRIWGRYIRLNLPIMAALIISFVLYKLHWYYNQPAAQLSGSSHWLIKIFPQYVSAHDFTQMLIAKSLFFGNNTLDTTLWTLKIEFVGSIYLLLFYLVCSEKHIYFCCLSVLLILYVFYGQETIFFAAIFFGSFIYRFDCKYPLCVILVGLYFGAYQYHFWLFTFLPDPVIFKCKETYNCIGAFLVTWAIIKGRPSRVFESYVAQYFGRVSFSLYLVHPLILGSIICFLYTHFPNSSDLAWIFVVYLSLAFLIAILFEKYIDRFAIRLSHWFSKKMIADR